MKRWLLGLALIASGIAHAADEDDHAAREQIKQGRQATEADSASQQAECRKRFVVTSCLNDARATQQKALRALREQELALDDVQRRQYSQEQAKRLADKAKKAQSHVEPEAKDASRSASAPQPSRQLSSRQAKSEPIDRNAKERAAREHYESRQLEIRTHREEVEQRNAKRAGSKSATPLPLPPSASAP
jgi:hypothetical protein